MDSIDQQKHIRKLNWICKCRFENPNDY